MQFKDLIIGQQFKPFGDDHVYTKGTYAGMYLSSQEAVASYAHHNNNWVCFPSEYIVLTLQKVKKTEKKWVKKTLRDVVAGTEFTFWAGTAGEKYTKLQSNAEDLKGKVFYVGTAVKCLYNSFPWTEVYVEEDTIIETEEWLP